MANASVHSVFGEDNGTGCVAKVRAGSREPLLESQLTGQFFRRLVITTLRRFAGAHGQAFSR